MRRKLVPAVVVVLAAAVIVLLAYGLTQEGSSRALDDAIAHHHPLPAPDSARPLPVLDRVHASSAALAHWRGKVVVLNFWASWCSTCTGEARLIERAERSLAASGQGTVLGVDYEDASFKAMGFINQYAFTFPNLRDADGSFADAFGTVALPETFVLNRSQRVVALYRGPVTSWASLRSAIALAERA